MRIAVINSIYKPDTRGGAEVVVENVVHGLEKNHEVFVIAVGRKTVVETGHAPSIKVYRIKPFNFFNFLDINSKPAWLRFLWHTIDMMNDIQTWRIYRVLKKEQPDIVLTHNLKGLGYYIPWLLRILKIKQIHTVHDMQLLHPSGLLRGRPMIFYSWIAKKFFGSPDAVVFPSEYIKGVYEKYRFFKKSKRVIIANPSSNLKFKIQNSIKIQNSKLEILYLGQVEEYKGIFDLLTAIEKIDSDFVLNVVGDGSALEKATKLVGSDKRIKFHGRLSQKELEQKIWPKMGLLVNPSKVPESFGMVLIEAYRHGVPVIATKIGALPELITDKTGFLFESGNIVGLQEKIQQGIDNPQKLAQMQKNCQKEAEKYNIDEYLNKLEKLIKL